MADDYFSDWANSLPLKGGQNANASSSSKGSTSTTGAGTLGYYTEGDSLAPHREAIAKIESGGDYSKLGPYNERHGYPLGKYQVMEDNLPSWSKAAIGRPVSKEEFLANPKIQDAVFNHQFGQTLAERGPADAASIWFTGRPLAEGKGKSDVLGTTGQSYVDQYLKNLWPATQTAAAKPIFDDDLLEKMYPGITKQGGATPQAPTANPPLATRAPQSPSESPTPSWGPTANFMAAATPGGGVSVPAHAQTQQALWNRIAQAARGQGAFPTPQEAQGIQGALQQELPTAQQQWTQENPRAALGTSLGGQLLPIAAGVGGMNALLRGTASSIPAAAPIANFLGGTAGRAMPGALGGLTQAASDVGAGASQGAVAGGMTGQDVGEGAKIGGALGPLGGLVGRGIETLTQPAIRPEVAAAAQKYIQSGGSLPASALTSNAGVKKILQSASGKGDAEMVEDFTKAIGDRIGATPIMAQEGVKGLTSDVMEKTKEALYKGFDDFAAKRGVNPSQKLSFRLTALDNAAEKELGVASPEAASAVQKAIERIHAVVDTAKSEGRPITGSEFRQLTGSDGTIDQLFKSGNRNTTPYAEKLKDTLYQALSDTLPEAKAEIDKLRQQYADYLKVDRVAPKSTHGLLDPQQFANRYGAEDGELGNLAQMGAFLPKLDASGAVKGAGGSFVSKHPVAAIGLAGFAAEHSDLIMHNWPLAAAAGGAYTAKHVLGNYLGSEGYLKNILQTATQGPPAARNLLTTPLVAPYTRNKTLSQ